MKSKIDFSTAYAAVGKHLVAGVMQFLILAPYFYKFCNFLNNIVNCNKWFELGITKQGKAALWQTSLHYYFAVKIMCSFMHC